MGCSCSINKPKHNLEHTELEKKLKTKNRNSGKKKVNKISKFLNVS